MDPWFLALLDIADHQLHTDCGCEGLYVSPPCIARSALMQEDTSHVETEDWAAERVALVQVYEHVTDDVCECEEPAMVREPWPPTCAQCGGRQPS